MLTTLAIGNYRSINHLVLPLGQLNLVTGANGSGKSNLYKALRLLAETAQGGVIEALAREGGLDSTWWAGPEMSARMKRGEVPIQGQHPSEAKRLRLGFATEDFGFAISVVAWRSMRHRVGYSACACTSMGFCARWVVLSCRMARCVICC
jgi:predicted ATPase